MLTHSLHYGLAVFEGVRAYKTTGGTQIFRLREHTERLFASAKILRMKMPCTIEEAMQALDFRPSVAARILSGAKSNQIALIYDNHSPHYIHQIQTGVWARCVEEGVTEPEILEIFDVGLVVGGSIVIPHLRRARDLLDEVLAGKKVTEASTRPYG